MGEYLPDLLPMRLREVAPLQVSQPDGVDVHPGRQPAQLAELAAAARLQPPGGPGAAPGRLPDGGRLRPVAHRLSFAEMVVPYRDASPDHYRRTAFDIGEWGLGFMTTSLTLGCDCLGEITYLDAVVHDSHGRAGDDTERDLRPRGGQRGPVEARGRAGRRRGPPGPAPGRLLPRDRGQLRVPGVLAVLPGRRHRVRGPRHRDHGHLAHRGAGQPPGQRDVVDQRHLRPVPPALHRGPPRPRRGRDRQHRLPPSPAGAARPGRPVRARPDDHQHPAAHRGGGQAGLRLGHAARLEGRQ